MQVLCVASLQKEVSDRREREFPSRIVYTKCDCDSRERECLPFALVETLLSAKCTLL